MVVEVVNDHVTLLGIWSIITDMAYSYIDCDRDQSFLLPPACWTGPKKTMLRSS